MPIFSRPWEHARRPWEHAKDSCGTEISTNAAGRGNRAWVAVGRASEIFDSPLSLRINNVLKMVDLEHVEVSYRLYMVGKTEATSRPVVMICCTDKAAGTKARDALRKSKICSDFPKAGFEFGRIKHPLESICASQPCAAEKGSWDLSHDTDDGLADEPAEDVFSPCTSPAIGRRLFKSQINGRLVHWATGGVLICIGDSFFQLTTEHVWDDNSADEDTASHDDDESDIWSMDGLDEDDDSEFSQLDHDVLSQASVTPEPSLRSPSMISLELSQRTPWEDSSDDETASQNTDRHLSPRLPRSRCNTSGIAMAPAHDFAQVSPLGLETLTKIGMISMQSSDGVRPGLDYAVIAIAAPNLADLVNGLIVPDGHSQRRHLRVRDFAKARKEEKRVFLVAGTNDVKSGILIPGTTMFKRKDHDSFQEMQLVQLDGIVSRGDCGAAVLDQTHGTFYGYLVRGCPGTGVAYIVPATSLFADLSARGLDAKLASSNASNFISGRESPVTRHKIAFPLIGRRLAQAKRSVQGCLGSGRWLRPNAIDHGHRQQQYEVKVPDPVARMSATSGFELWSKLLELDGDSPHITRKFNDFSNGATLQSLSNRKIAKPNIWVHQWNSERFGRPLILNASAFFATRAIPVSLPV